MKKNLSHCLFQIAALFLLLMARADSTAINTSSYTSPIKTACVGDSITYGGGTGGDRLTHGYPGQLQSMLGDKWKVGNFGHNGATLLNSGDLPYQKVPECQQALSFNPDVVVIMLGTNDSKGQNWKHKDQFVADYKDLIGKFQALPSKPHIFIAYPVAVGPNAGFGISNGPVKEEQALIDQVVSETGATLIDLYTPTTEKWELYNADHVHPAMPGARVMAQTVYKALTGQDYTGPETPFAPAPPPAPAATPPASPTTPSAPPAQ